MPIVGYEGHYEVSNLGSIKGLERKVEHRGRLITIPEKIKVLQMGTTGYYIIMLYKKKAGKVLKVHRLVAAAFKDNPLNMPIVNHIDSNKLNNHIDNLEWCSARENLVHSYRFGGRKPVAGEKVFTASLTPELIHQIKSLRGQYSERKMAKFLGVGRMAVHGVLSGQTWKNIQPFIQ